MRALFNVRHQSSVPYCSPTVGSTVAASTVAASCDVLPRLGCKSTGAANSIEVHAIPSKLWRVPLWAGSGVAPGIGVAPARHVKSNVQLRGALTCHAACGWGSSPRGWGPSRRGSQSRIPRSAAQCPSLRAPMVSGRADAAVIGCAGGSGAAGGYSERTTSLAALAPGTAYALMWPAGVQHKAITRPYTWYTWYMALVLSMR